MSAPLVYELNTRCWLDDLSTRAGTPLTLARVPDSEFESWRRHGFTHVWLMGVWEVGPRSRAEVLGNSELRQRCQELLPDFEPRDLVGSPYAIAACEVAESLGGNHALRAFRKRLRDYGLQLLLDFVPNHVGLDHAWVRDHPEWFVHSTCARPGTIRQDTPAGELWLAHGKDPNFPPWADTVQLDYRRPETRAAVIAELEEVARLCDGVRCDMAMLQLNDVFVQTWQDFPCSAPPPAVEFWPRAIEAVKRGRPDFLLLAEVYWGLEAKLQEQGFDYTYDKRLYDELLARNPSAVQRHLLSHPSTFIGACAHFLENHDEPRVAAGLAPAEHRAAALLMMGLPGLRLVHEGQLTGACCHTPVQLGRRPCEPVQPLIAGLYDHLLGLLPATAIGRGQGLVLTPWPAWSENPTWTNFVVIQWQSAPPAFDLVVVNLAAHRSQCYVPLEAPDLAKYNWHLEDLLGSEKHDRFGDDLQNQGLYLDVGPHGAQVFHFSIS